MKTRIAKKIVRNIPDRYEQYRDSTVAAAYRRLGTGLYRQRKAGTAVTFQWSVTCATKTDLKAAGCWFFTY